MRKEKASPGQIMAILYMFMTILCIISIKAIGIWGIIFLLLEILSMFLYHNCILIPAETYEREIKMLDNKVISDETKISELKKQLSDLSYLCMQQREEITRLRHITYNNQASISYSEEVKEAIKYARNKSHPDNGGNQADFIKFNNLYKKMK